MKQSHYLSRLPLVLALFLGITVASCGDGRNDSAAPPVVIDANGCTTGPAATPVDTPVCRGKANFNDRVLAADGLGGSQSVAAGVAPGPRRPADLVA